MWIVVVIMSVKLVVYEVHSSVRNACVSYCGQCAVTEFVALRQTGSGTFLCNAPVITKIAQWVDELECLVHFVLVAACSYTVCLLYFAVI